MISWRLGAVQCLNPQLTREELEQKHGYRSPWLDRCNSWTYRRGFAPSRGFVLMQVGQARELSSSQAGRHTLEIRDGNKFKRWTGLSVVRSEAIFATINSGVVHANTPCMVEIADARHDAIESSVNGQINVRAADSRRVPSTGDLTLRQALLKLWERLSPIFSQPLTINVVEPYVKLENLEFVGMSAWEAFTYVCELSGCSFRFLADGRPEVFSLANSLERSNATAIESAIPVDSTGWLEQPDLPEFVRVFTQQRDYQWYQNASSETAQDYHRLEPTYSKTFDVFSLVPQNGPTQPTAHDNRAITPLITQGSTKVLWGTLPLIVRDDQLPANKSEVDGQLKWIAERWVTMAISTRLNATFTFSGIVNLIPDSRYGSVIYRHQMEALTTMAASGELAQEFPGRWAMDLGSGRPSMRDRQPYGRELYCKILKLAEASPGIKQSDAKDSTIAARALCRVDVLSGVIGPSGVEWTSRKTVEAVNGMDRPVRVGQFAYAKWNYQLGGGGYWVIVSVAGASGELSDWCSVCLDDFEEIECVDDPVGMSVNKGSHLRLVEYDEITSDGTVKRVAIDIRPGPKNSLLATLNDQDAKPDTLYWSTGPVVTSIRLNQGNLTLQKNGIRTVLGPSNTREEARHRMPGPSKRSGQYLYTSATGPGNTADWGWLGPGGVGTIRYAASCFDPADIIDHLCDYIANCASEGNAWGAAGKPANYQSPCEVKTFTVTNGLIIGGEGLTTWEERHTSRLQDPDVEHFNECGSETGTGTDDDSGGKDPDPPTGGDGFPLPDEDDGTTGGVGPEDEQLGNPPSPFAPPDPKEPPPNAPWFKLPGER